MGRHSGRNDTDGQAVMRVPEGARVLVARSPDRAGDLVAALRKVGADPLLLPLIDFELARDQHSLDVAFDALGAGAYAWLVVSSVTTVQALEAKAAERGTTLSRWLPGSLLVATIGPATRRFLESRGVAVDLAPTGQQSGAGLHRYLARAPGQRAAAAGRHRRPPAPPRAGGPGRLRPGRDRVPHRGLPGRPAPEPRRVPARHAARAECRRRTARGSAAAVLTPDQAKTEIGAGRLAAVVAASPSAARRIHEDLAPLGGCRFVAIGRSTAAEAESLGLTVAAVAEEPTASGLVAAVVRSLAGRPSPPPQPAAEPTAKDTV